MKRITLTALVVLLLFVMVGCREDANPVSVEAGEMSQLAQMLEQQQVRLVILTMAERNGFCFMTDTPSRLIVNNGLEQQTYSTATNYCENKGVPVENTAIKIEQTVFIYDPPEPGICVAFLPPSKVNMALVIVEGEGESEKYTSQIVIDASFLCSFGVDPREFQRRWNDAQNA